MVTITKDTIVGDILDIAPETAPAAAAGDAFAGDAFADDFGAFSFESADFGDFQSN